MSCTYSDILSVAKKIFGLGISCLVIFVIGSTQFSSVPVAYAQSCQLPTQVQNVQVVFPSCTGNVCNFSQGSCTWSSLSGATGYQVIVTEVETNTTVQNQSVGSGVTSNSFPVKESNTYKCSVAAINACGTGPAGTASLLCKIDAAVTISPTVPVSTVAPTAIPTTPPTIVPKKLLTAGSSDGLIFAGLGSLAVLLIGMSLLIM